MSSEAVMKPKRKRPRKPVTPLSRIRSALRTVWLRSRERAQAVKDQKNTCQECGRKGSVAKGREVKIEVHHIDRVDWDGILRLVRDQLLQDPSRLRCLCKECHKKTHEREAAREKEM
jgi:predicted HNH restriction endonuclease